MPSIKMEKIHYSDCIVAAISSIFSFYFIIIIQPRASFQVSPVYIYLFKL